MFIEFTVGNYRSFFAPMTLSLEATTLQSAEKTLDEQNVFQSGDLRLLRSAAIYGANASGKSNLIRAMAFMRKFVLQSAKESQAGEPTGIERFRLNTAARQEPALFQIIFIMEGRQYRYGFEIDEQRVRSEWLYHKTQRETRLFLREGQQFELSGPFVKEGKGIETRTRDNALFLSVVAQFNGPIAANILKWFRTGFNVISGLEDVGYLHFTLQRFETDETFRQRVLDFIRLADVGITDVTLETRLLAEMPMPDEIREFIQRLAKTEKSNENGPFIKQIVTQHPVFDAEHHLVGQEAFSMEEQESAGTQKIFNLSGPLWDTLEQGKVLIIDEIEARLHPLLTLELMRLFNSPQTNPNNAQLIFATHDTGLLGSSLLRRDQIWFTEKDSYGATNLYSLAELQVRNDAAFDKQYIAGHYGAIPCIGGLRSLFEGLAPAAEAETQRVAE